MQDGKQSKGTQWFVILITCDGIYAIARICYRPSVCQMGGSKKNSWS